MARCEDARSVLLSMGDRSLRVEPLGENAWCLVGGFSRRNPVDGDGIVGLVQVLNLLRQVRPL